MRIVFAKMVILVLLLLTSVTGAQPNTAANPAQERQLRTPSQEAELDEAKRLTNSVIRLFGERKFEEAVAPAKRALELSEKVLGKDDELVNSAVLNLAEVQYARERFDESKNLFERILRSLQRTLGPDNVRLSKLLDRLAVNYFVLGQPSQTEKLYKQSLAIRQKALGVTHPETAQSLYNLAEFYQLQENYKEAEPLYQELIDVRKKTNADAAQLVEAIDRYACLLRKQKRTAEADQIEGPSAPHADKTEPAINGGVVNGKAIKLVQPPYPDEARATRASGRVRVQIVIGETGDVIRVCAVDGAKSLMKASELAASRSKFSPTLLDGKPVRVRGVIIYNYAAR